MKIFDTHTHYIDPVYDEDRNEVLRNIYESGVENIDMKR